MESSPSFPSPEESTVASALLLLSSSSSTSPPSPPSGSKWSKSHADDHSAGSLFAPINSISKSRASSSSTMTSDDGSSPETPGGGRPLRLVSVSAAYHDLQFKVVRKSRSKTLWISDCQKNSSSKVPMSSSETVSETTEASSCLTTGSIYSSVSSGGGSSTTATTRPRRNGEREREVNVARGGPKKEQVYYPANSSRRAQAIQAILRLLSDGCCLSEVKIRELLGDSPDTSKALRMLLKKEQVTRSGAGGRADPFIYKKA